MSGHTCHAFGCATRCKPELLMCPRCWAKVAPRLQRAVYTAYRRGQCDDMSPSLAWHVAADDAILDVATKTNQPEAALAMLRARLDASRARLAAERAGKPGQVDLFGEPDDR